MEDYAYVLDVLTEGRPDSKRRFRREPVVYGLGIEGVSYTHLTLPTICSV